MNSVGWYEICAFSYLATFGSVSSAFNIGRVLLKNSNVSRFNKSLKSEKTTQDIISLWNGNKICNNWVIIIYAELFADITYKGYETPSTVWPMGFNGRYPLFRSPHKLSNVCSLTFGSLIP